MLPVSMVLFVVILRHVRRGDWNGGQRLVRVFATAAATAIAVGTALWLHHLANSPDTYWPAYVLTGSIFVGALAYSLATTFGNARGALPARWIGWIAMAAPLLVPSTFSLFLPVVAALAVTLREYNRGLIPTGV
jgi:hypothetical protein